MNKLKRLLAGITGLALCAAPAASAAGFPDVPADSWYASAVDFCAETGLMAGVGGVFRPEAPMTRAMLVTVLYNLVGAPTSTGSDAFPDVSGEDWYYNAALWAKSKGLISGDVYGNFAGDSAVSREQAAVILWRGAGSPSAGEGPFSDAAAINPYARAAANWASASGVISGLPDGRFAPQQTVTRAQMAGMLMQYVPVLLTPTLTELPLLGGNSAPCGIMVTGDGCLMICDTYNRVVWRVDDTASKIYAGMVTAPDPSGRPMGGYNDSTLAESCFMNPWGIAPFLSGYAVTDPENNVVRLVENGRVRTLNCSNGDAGFDGLAYPTGIAAGEDGCIYVSDTHNGAVRRIDADGTMTTVAEKLSDPMGLCWKDGALYVAETGAHRILKITGGRTEVLAGNGAEGLTDGAAALASFSLPQAVAVDDAGTVYVADTGNSAVRRIAGGRVDTILVRDPANINEAYPVSPCGLALDGSALLICDSFAHTILLLQL